MYVLTVSRLLLSFVNGPVDSAGGIDVVAGEVGFGVVCPVKSDSRAAGRGGEPGWSCRRRGIGCADGADGRGDGFVAAGIDGRDVIPARRARGRGRVAVLRTRKQPNVQLGVRAEL